MPDQVWYTFENGVQQGPMSLEALRVLADQGKLKADSLVTRVGMTDWVPARSVPELFPFDTIVRPPLPPGVGPHRDPLAFGRTLAERLRRSVSADDVVESLPHLRGVRFLLQGLRRGLTETGLDRTDRIARQTGHVFYIAAALFIVVAFMILGIRSDSFHIFFSGLLILAPAAIILHFLAVLFLDAGTSLLRKSPSELSSPAVLTLAALVFVAGSLCCLLMGIYGLITGDPFVQLLLRLGGFAVLLYACAVALNPATVNVTAGADLSAGEEALGIGMFLVKLPLRLVPFLFGVGSVVGLCAAVYLIYLIATEEPLFVTDPAHQIAHGVLAVALVPFVAYLGFAVAYLLVDLLRAILRTPARIDALREDGRGRR
jgi:GYF domain 2